MALETIQTDNRFPKESRIRKRRDFLNLSNTGSVVHSRCFLIVFASNTVGETRLGISVSRKVGNSVVRNRIKRHAREFFRLNRHRFRFRDSKDLHLIAKKHASELAPFSLHHALETIFLKIV
jgi:ribonuclease P protein component